MQKCKNFIYLLDFSKILCDDMHWKISKSVFFFKTTLITPEEPLFRCFWTQNRHVPYFLFHCFVFPDSSTVKFRVHCYSVLVSVRFSNVFRGCRKRSVTWLKWVNLFHVNVPFLYPLKTSENLWFSDVFSGYKNGTLAWKNVFREYKNGTLTWKNVFRGYRNGALA